MEGKEPNSDHVDGNGRSRDNRSDEYLGPNMSRDEALHRVRTSGAVSLSPELFEKLYLSPKGPTSGHLRKMFGNPTPIALVGFLLSLFPLSMNLMGWRGADGGGAAGIPAYFFFGGLLMLIGGIFEWILGNSFPAIVFLSFSGFWLTFGGTLNPSFAAFTSYAAPDAAAPSEGLETTGFNASFGFFLLSMMMLTLVFLICSLRTNITFVVIFFTLVMTFALLTGAYWTLAQDFTGNADLANRLIMAGGAFAFVTCLAGWWIFFAIMLAILDFPFQVPVGDLSNFIRAKSQKDAANQV